MSSRIFSFVGGAVGVWRVETILPVIGEPLAEVPRLDVVNGSLSALPEHSKWMLRGIKSNERYVTRDEKDELKAHQPQLGRPAATCAALIPIRKTASWWELPQDERRSILEERSRHIKTGLKYLPAIARSLHHCRDLGEPESFDFLTWFEYAPADAPAFEELAADLRATEEWQYVEREVDIRLSRTPA
ncbi:MAG: chlorite dismutase family protein [Blastocatellia bacterium]|nr:chlorite dismutase family protein [Blastocatellia bacterium]